MPEKERPDERHLKLQVLRRPGGEPRVDGVGVSRLGGELRSERGFDEEPVLRRAGERRRRPRLGLEDDLKGDGGQRRKNTHGWAD